MRKRSCILCLFLALLVTVSVSTIASAVIYRKQGYIAKAFSIDKKQKIGTVTGSILYQKNYSFTKDQIVFQGLTTNGLTATFKLYANEDNFKKITIPAYNGQYKFKEVYKKSKTYAYAQMKIDSSYKEKITLIADE